MPFKKKYASESSFDTTVPPPVVADPEDDHYPILANLLRGASGLVSGTASFVPGLGSLAGAGIAGAGESLAEKLEGSPQSPARIAVEAALGAVPMSKFFKAGRVAASAMGGGAMSAAGEAGREYARGEDIRPLDVAKAGGFGAIMGGGLAGLLGKLGVKPLATPKVEPLTPGQVAEVETTIRQGKGTSVLTGGDIKYSKTNQSGTLVGAKNKPNVGPKPLKGELPITEPIAEVNPAGAGRIPYGGPDPTVPSPSGAKVIAAEEKARLAKIKVDKTKKAQEEIDAYITEHGLEPGAPSISESSSAPTATGTIRSSTRWKAPEVDKAGTTIDPLKALKDLLTPEAHAAYKSAEVAAGRKPLDFLHWVGQAKKGAGAPIIEEAAVSVKPNLYDEYINSLRKGSVPEGTEWVDDAGNVIGHTTNKAGSTGFKPVTKPKGFVEPELAEGGYPKSWDEIPGHGEIPLERPVSWTAKTGPESKLKYPNIFGGRPDYSKVREVPFKGAPPAPPFDPDLGPAGPSQWARGATSTEPPAPDWITKQSGIVDRLKELAKKESGGINPVLATRLGLGGLGAAAGATQGETPGERFRNAALGGATGALLPSAIPLLKNIGVPSKVLESVPSDSSPKTIVDHIKNTWNMLPSFQRFNYLLDAEGLPANAFVGPYGSLFFSSLEGTLNGDPRALAVFKEIVNPINFLKEYKAVRASGAASLLPAFRAEGLPMSQLAKGSERLLASPGLAMTMGDMAARNILARHGFPEDAARTITLTSEAMFPTFKRFVKFGQPVEGKNAVLANLLAPFRRTPANIVEQGGMRLPGIGELVQRARGENMDPLKLRLIQQGMGLGVGAGSAALGANVDPETAKVMRRYVSTLAVSIAFQLLLVLQQDKLFNVTNHQLMLLFLNLPMRCRFQLLNP